MGILMSHESCSCHYQLLYNNSLTLASHALDSARLQEEPDHSGELGKGHGLNSVWQVPQGCESYPDTDSWRWPDSLSLASIPVDIYQVPGYVHSYYNSMHIYISYIIQAAQWSNAVNSRSKYDDRISNKLKARPVIPLSSAQVDLVEPSNS